MAATREELERALKRERKIVADKTDLIAELRILLGQALQEIRAIASSYAMATQGKIWKSTENLCVEIDEKLKDSIGK